MAKRSQNARDEKGKWDIGGGAMEFDETVEQTLRKEIKEEYNVDVLSFEFLGYRDVHRSHDGQKSHWIALDFKVLVDPTNAKINEPHKFEDLKWCPISEMIRDPALVHSQLPGFLEKYRKRL